MVRRRRRKRQNKNGRIETIKKRDTVRDLKMERGM